MRKFFLSSKFKGLCVVLAIVLVATIAAAASRGKNSVISQGLNAVFAPIQKLSAYTAEKIGAFGGSFVASSTYQKEVEELEAELDKARKELVDFEKAKNENKLYQDFLGVKEENPSFKFASASVVGRDAADMFYSFRINSGSNEGVKLNDPVISGEYLIGVVTKVSTNYSLVRTILDPTVSVGAYEIHARTENGYVAGDPTLALNGLTKLSGLPIDTAITAGGIVCTSGIGGVYPRNLIIGTVTQVENSSHDVSAYAVLKPGVDITKISDVFVIVSFEGQGVTEDFE